MPVQRHSSAMQPQRQVVHTWQLGGGARAAQGRGSVGDASQRRTSRRPSAQAQLRQQVAHLAHGPRVLEALPVDGAAAAGRGGGPSVTQQAWAGAQCAEEQPCRCAGARLCATCPCFASPLARPAHMPTRQTPTLARPLPHRHAPASPAQPELGVPGQDAGRYPVALGQRPRRHRIRQEGAVAACAPATKVWVELGCGWGGVGWGGGGGRARPP
jgi:hypothetical protein